MSAQIVNKNNDEIVKENNFEKKKIFDSLCLISQFFEVWRKPED